MIKNDKFEVHVSRKNKGRKKRKSRANNLNAEQNSEHSDVIENDLEDELDDNDKCDESDNYNYMEDYKLGVRIATDAQLKAKPNYKSEELSDQKYEDEPLTDELTSESAEVQEIYNVRALSKHAETYELEKFEKNALLIFNQENVEGFIPRYGTEKDVEAIKNTFENFGFEVTEYKDFTKKEIFDRLEAFSAQDFTEYGCIGIAVLTHGSHYGLLRAKDQQYSEIEIINLFKVHDKPTLVTKPKFLIVQACRGTDIIPGAPVLLSRKIRTDVDSSKEPYILPVEADMLILHSSYVGSPSHRDELTGSWFIQSLCNKINELAATHDVESIITEVKKAVAIDKEHEVYNRRTLEMQVNKQMPVMTTTLIRKLYLRKFGDPPSPRLITASESQPSTSHADSNEVLDFAPANSPMLVQFGPCSCFLGHFEYIKNCLRFFVEENPDDDTAQCFLEIANQFEDGVNFNGSKEKLAKAMCKHLIKNAKHCDYYKYLYFYKHF